MRRTGSVILIAAALAATPGLGEAPPPFPEFTFKRAKPPAPGASRRITVQIAPKPLTPPPREEAAEAPPAGGARYGWYWEVVSPARQDSAPGRLGPAVAALSNGPGGARVHAPRLGDLQQIAKEFGAEILIATAGTQVSPALVLAVIGVESGGSADAISPKGASGLMQLMPATAARFGIKDPSDPSQNIRAGVAYLDWLMSAFERDPVLVLAAYNAGETAVSDNGGVPDYPETRDYVPKVLSAWTVARGLCATPPELISDGCVLRALNTL
jgi:hypothetical protein